MTRHAAPASTLQFFAPRFSRPRFSSNAGLTLVETTIVLAVVSVIVAAVWMVSSVVYENARQYTANRQLQTVVQNIRQVYLRINKFSAAGTALTATLDGQSVFPVEMRYNQSATTGVINHPWSTSSSGTVTVATVSTTTFGITFSNLPRKACVGLATKLSGGDLTGLQKVSVNSSSNSGSSLPLTVVTANTQCTSASSNTITWEFGLRDAQ